MALGKIIKYGVFDSAAVFPSVKKTEERNRRQKQQRLYSEKIGNDGRQYNAAAYYRDIKPVARRPFTELCAAVTVELQHLKIAHRIKNITQRRQRRRQQLHYYRHKKASVTRRNVKLSSR